MGSLIRLELYQHSREWIFWSVFLGGLVVLGLAFYPAIADSIDAVSVIFENPLMGTMLSAFGADPSALGTLDGFYQTYASIYVTLLGCVYAVLSGVARLGRERERGTLDYLLTRPIRRRTVFAIKLLVLVFHIVLLNGVVYLTSIVALEGFGSAAPKQVYPVPRIVATIEDRLKQNPTVAKAFVSPSPDLFSQILIEGAHNQAMHLGSTRRGMQNLNGMEIDAETIDNLLSQLSDVGPEALLTAVENDPDRYRAFFGETDLTVEEIRLGVMERRQELEKMHEAFRSDPSTFHEFFRIAPKTILSASISEGTFADTMDALGLPRRWRDRVYATYSTNQIGQRVLFSSLAMVVFGSLGMFLATLGGSSTGGTMGIALSIVFVSYMIDVVTSAIGAGNALRWLSPIAMISGAPIAFEGIPPTLFSTIYYILSAVVFSFFGLRQFLNRDVCVT